MTTNLVMGAGFWIHTVPANNEVSTTLSPRQKFTCLKLTSKHTQLAFGEYVQTYEEGDNTMRIHTLGAIALQPLGNLQGTYMFITLWQEKRYPAKDGHHFPCVSL